MHDILTRLAKCRVDTRPGQCGASNLQGGNHTYPYSETIRDLPVRCAQGAGVRISKVWKTQVISRPQETGKRGRKCSRLFCLWSYTVTGSSRSSRSKRHASSDWNASQRTRATSRDSS